MLRLLAQTADDLTVVSALLQDAVVRPSDICFDAKRQRFVLLMHRYRWEADHGRTRIRSALRLEHVTQVQRRKMDTGEEILSLLSLVARKATPDQDDPAEIFDLLFSGGATLRLHADSMDVVLEDLTDSWQTVHIPTHKDVS